MKKDIRYGGYSADRSDYTSEDGEMAVALDLVHEEGGLRPVYQPQELFGLEAGDKIWLIHSTSAYKHYILTTYDGTFVWIDAADPSQRRMIRVFAGSQSAAQQYFKFDTPVLKMETVGNTLAVMCEDGLHYMLWDANSALYEYLGQKPPMVELEFGLSENKNGIYEPVGYTDFTMSGEPSPVCMGALEVNISTQTKVSSDRHKIIFSGSAYDEVNDTLWTMINKSNATVNKDGHFYAPFYVRYCYRMYDGTMWMQSAPVFMPVSSPDEFHATFFLDDGNHEMVPYYVDSHGRITPSSSQLGIPGAIILYWPNNVALKFKVMNGSALNELRNSWGDIVKSVDIFVSQPLVRENNSEKITTMIVRDDVFTLRNGEVAHWTPTMTLEGESASAPKILFEIPKLSEDAYLDKIQSEGSFYKVASYDLETDSLPTDEFTEVDINKEALQSLEAQEVMKDDYKSHNVLMPVIDTQGRCLTNLLNYNKRLHICNLKERLFEGFGAEGMLPQVTNTPQVSVSAIAVTLKTEEGSRMVVHDYGENPVPVSGLMLFRMPLFYPDSRAVAMDIYSEPDVLREGWYKKYTLKMSSHEMLNGSVTKAGMIDSLTYTEPEYTEVNELPSGSNDILSLENKLYVSEIENPFYFPVTGINTVGSGAILGINTAAVPLSEGQFGAFPLYAFTTDGVWALSVNSEGAYTTVQPISQEVVTDADSITPMSNAVLFTTERGIMHIRGREVVCISEPIASEHPFDVLTLPHADKLLQLAGHTGDGCLPTQPFLAFLDGCRMLYDYLNQRVVVFNPTQEDGAARYGYAYVFSLKSKLWSMMKSDLADVVKAYPDTIAVNQDNKAVTFGNGSDGEVKGLFVTRPLKMGDGNAMKSVHTVIQRGYFGKGDVNTVLYGSNDLRHWHLVGSSTDEAIHNLHGTPYKYFRVAGVTTLADGEDVGGAAVEYELRDTDKLH